MALLWGRSFRWTSYYAFRSYPERSDDEFRNDIIGQICKAGIGMVAPDDGDLLIGFTNRSNVAVSAGATKDCTE